MTNHIGDPRGEAGGRFCTVQPERDPEANWEVNLAKKLEDYLLKICSAEIHSGNEEDEQLSMNFAEAALLLQGSVQVYSRKVEYLYSLVLHTLEFISQNRQQNQPEGTSVQQEESGSHAASNEETDSFWCPDEVPVETKNCLDTSKSNDGLLNQFVKPPANLVVLEGECLDSTGDAGELESYLLATSELYQGFILLDACDSVAVNEFLKEDHCGKEQNSAYRGSLTRKSVHSVIRCTGGTVKKSNLGKGQDVNCNQTPLAGSRFEANTYDKGPGFIDHDNFTEANHSFHMGDHYSEPGDDLDDSDDDNDPWKPLNPHEPGNLKVKPFSKVKPFRRLGGNSLKKNSAPTLFPLARMHGTISPELSQIWEKRQCASEKRSGSQSPPLYEKLRQSLVHGDGTSVFGDPADDNEDNGFDGEFTDFGQQDADLPEDMHMDDIPAYHNEDDNTAQFDTNEASGNKEPDSHASLEDLCRSHLDALLASIAKNEKQTELAARVSTWKNRIEHNLEEQDSRAPFDIHEYGARVLDKLPLEASGTKKMAFTDVVRGQEKHDVARTFSALLQLVNNEEVDLEKSGIEGGPVCYSAVNPFHVRLLKHDKRREEEARPKSSKKRAKSPKRKGEKEKLVSAELNCFSATEGGKRRRRSQLLQPVD